MTISYYVYLCFFFLKERATTRTKTGGLVGGLSGEKGQGTGGSVFNLNTIGAEDLDRGVEKPAWKYKAYQGSGKFKNKERIGNYVQFSPYILNPLQ